MFAIMGSSYLSLRCTGYKPFVEACIEEDEKDEALKYIVKLSDPQERAEVSHPTSLTPLFPSHKDASLHDLTLQGKNWCDIQIKSSWGCRVYRTNLLLLHTNNPNTLDEVATFLMVDSDIKAGVLIDATLPQRYLGWLFQALNLHRVRRKTIHSLLPVGFQYAVVWKTRHVGRSCNCSCTDERERDLGPSEIDFWSKFSSWSSIWQFTRSPFSTWCLIRRVGSYQLKVPLFWANPGVDV